MKKAKIVKPEKTRKLSIWRMILAILILAGASYLIFTKWNNWQETKSIEVSKPWFAPYVDVTATPQYSFEQMHEASSVKNLVLSFIVMQGSYQGSSESF